MLSSRQQVANSRNFMARRVLMLRLLQKPQLRSSKFDHGQKSDWGAPARYPDRRVRTSCLGTPAPSQRHSVALGKMALTQSGEKSLTRLAASAVSPSNWISRAMDSQQTAAF